MVDVCLGADVVEIQTTDVEAVVKNGLVMLPIVLDLEKPAQPKQITTPVDPYVRDYIRSISLETLFTVFQCCCCVLANFDNRCF